MKKIYAVFGLVIAFNAFGQNVTTQRLDEVRYRSVDIVKGATDNSMIPYIYKYYVMGNVEGFSDNYKMRYNAYLDEVNFKKENADLALLKEEMYGTVNLTETKETLKLEKYNYKDTAIHGYLFVVGENENLTIYKKSSIIFMPATLARSSYDEDKPASYRKAADVYFIKKENAEIVEMPSNKNKLIAMFPDKKVSINQYFKANKVNLSDSGDLKKLVQIL